MKGYIYKLYCLDDNIKECYIGSCWDIEKRMINHKSSCTNINSKEYNRTIYKCIRVNGNWCNWDYEYFMVNVIDSTDLKMKEQDRMDIEVNTILNEVRAYTDSAEYNKQWNKQYRIDNKESINLNQKQKYNCECGGKYTRVHKKRHLRTYKHQAYLILQI